MAFKVGDLVGIILGMMAVVLCVCYLDSQQLNRRIGIEGRASASAAGALLGLHQRQASWRTYSNSSVGESVRVNKFTSSAPTSYSAKSARFGQINQIISSHFTSTPASTDVNIVHVKPISLNLNEPINYNVSSTNFSVEAWAARRAKFLLRHWSSPGSLDPWFERGAKNRTYEATCVLVIINQTFYGDCLKVCPTKRFHYALGYANIMREAVDSLLEQGIKVDDQKWLLACDDKDWPTFPMESGMDDVPAPVVAAVQNNGNFYDILIPSTIRAMFQPESYDHKWARKIYYQDNPTKNGAIPWSKRLNEVVWRGNLGCSVGCGRMGRYYNPASHAETCDEGSIYKRSQIRDPNKRGYSIGCDIKNFLAYKHERIRLVKLSRQNPSCVDAGFVLKGHGLQGTDKFESAVIAPPGTSPYIFFPEEFKATKSNESLYQELESWLRPSIKGYMTHKYMIQIGNNGFSDRLWMMLADGAVVFYVQNGWEEWFYNMLIPMVHFVPVKADLSDLCEKVAWIKDHPAKASEISVAARKFVREQMRPKDRDTYVGNILLEYGRIWKEEIASGKANMTALTAYQLQWPWPKDYQPRALRPKRD